MAEQLTFGEFDERFAKMTPSAVAALTLAKEEAQRHRQNYIGTEHQLLGLLHMETGLASTILHGLGVDLEGLIAEIEEILGKVGPGDVTGAFGLTLRAKQVIELAVEEARSLGHRYVGQEHLLLGFMREGDGIAPRLLLTHGVTLERLRAEVARLQALVKPDVLVRDPKNNVVTCRLTNGDVQALDDFVEAGVRSTRSDAAAWLIHIGIEANAQLLETVRGTVAEIRRLREQAQSLAQQVTGGAQGAQSAPESAAEASSC